MEQNIDKIIAKFLELNIFFNHECIQLNIVWNRGHFEQLSWGNCIGISIATLNLKLQSWRRSNVIVTYYNSYIHSWVYSHANLKQNRWKFVWIRVLPLFVKLSNKIREAVCIFYKVNHFMTNSKVKVRFNFSGLEFITKSVLKWLSTKQLHQILYHGELTVPLHSLIWETSSKECLEIALN